MKVLTTFDGKDIYINQIYYAVDRTTWMVLPLIATEESKPHDRILFADERLAEEFIDMNEPKYSKRDIINHILKLKQHIS